MWGDVKLVTNNAGDRSRCECPPAYFAHLGGDNVYYSDEVGGCQGGKVHVWDCEGVVCVCLCAFSFFNIFFVKF